MSGLRSDLADRLGAIHESGGVTLKELSAGAVIGDDSVEHPGVVAPEREYDVHCDGVRIRVHEWGKETDPPILLAHGGFDFARTYDVFAPLLAAGGWRVVSWDQRCHGDSEWTAMSSWSADLRDAAAVINAVTPGPLPILGHSKGGAISLRLAEAWPHRFTHVINIDGLPSRRAAPDVANHEASRMLADELGGWLDHRRRAADGRRKPGTLQELARRRAAMNPRLTHEWLCHLVSVGASRDDDGWRWKIDPVLRMGGFGPYRSEWALDSLPGLPMPFLGCLCTEPEKMGWGTKAADVRGFLPKNGHLTVFEGVGHFVHIEKPGETAAIVLEFLS